jgi:hypothetical protein
VIGAWLAGPTRIAVAIRHALAPYLAATLIAWAGFAAIVAALIFWWAPTPAMHNPVTAILLIALLAAGFEGLRRKVRSEVPAADLDAALHAHGERLRRLGHRIDQRPGPAEAEPGNGAHAATSQAPAQGQPQ